MADALKLTLTVSPAGLSPETAARADLVRYLSTRIGSAIEFEEVARLIRRHADASFESGRQSERSARLAPPAPSENRLG